MATMTDQMTSMRVGDKLVFSLDNVKSIRSLASQTGLALNRFYETKTDRETRTITVTRRS